MSQGCGKGANEAWIDELCMAFEDINARSKEISAAMQEFDLGTFGHRLYHEAPNDVFDLIVLQLSDVHKDGYRNGGLNALRLVSKRCMQVVESMATRLTHNGNINSLPVIALKRCRRIEHIRCNRIMSLEGCPDELMSIIVDDGRFLQSLEPLSACKHLEILDMSNAYRISDLSPLSYCRRLRKLILYHSEVTDLTPLASTPLLEELDLCKSGGRSIEDLSPLSYCKRLKKLNLESERMRAGFMP